MTLPGADPTHGLTPGAEIDNPTKYFKNCRCGESVMMGRVLSIYPRREYKWKAFEPRPVENNGCNYYRVHRCGER